MVVAGRFHAGVLRQSRDQRLRRVAREYRRIGNASDHPAGQLRAAILESRRQQDRGLSKNRRASLSYCVIIFCRLYGVELLPQQGHRGRVLMSALINRRRMVAIEFGTWRSGRKGGSSGSMTFG